MIYSTLVVFCFFRCVAFLVLKTTLLDCSAFGNINKIPCLILRTFRTVLPFDVQTLVLNQNRFSLNATSQFLKLMYEHCGKVFRLILSLSQEMCESGRCRVDGGRPLQELMLTAILNNRSLQSLCSCITLAESTYHPSLSI